MWVRRLAQIHAAAEQASCRKSVKYDLFEQAGHLFQPIVAESPRPVNESSTVFFSELGQKIVSAPRDNRKPSFLFSAFQSLSSASTPSCCTIPQRRRVTTLASLLCLRNRKASCRRYYVFGCVSP